MQIDLCLLHNVRSEATSAGRGGLRGGRTTERASQPGNQGSDFRSDLKRAEARKNKESPRPPKREDSPVQTKNRSQGMSASRNPKATRSVQDAADCRRREGLKSVPENSDDTPAGTEGFCEAPADAGTVDSANGIFSGAVAAGPADAIVPPSEAITPPADAITPEIPVLSEPANSLTSLAAVGPDQPVAGTAETAAVAPKDTEAGVQSSPAIDAPETGEDAIGDATGDAIDESSDPSENEAMEKGLSESQKRPSRHDDSAQAAEKTSDGRQDKIEAGGAFEAQRQSSEAAKKSGPTAPTAEGARVAEDLNRKTAVDPANGRAEPDRLERLAADSQRDPRTETPPAGQNDSRGAGDTSGAAVPKAPVDADQSAKVNELLPASQRPVSGEGNTQALPQTVETQPSSPKADVLNQIVDRAVFKLNNGQSEVRIDLKPDFLGHVRLQIVTENHQVSLRILAESSAVKDLIDGNLGQLKTDLQAQGLKVDEIDVTVAKDFNSFDRRSGYAAHGDRGRRGLPFKDRGLQEKGIAAGSRMAAQLAQRAGGINCFA